MNGAKQKNIGWKVIRICLRGNNKILLSAQIHIKISPFV